MVNTVLEGEEVEAMDAEMWWVCVEADAANDIARLLRTRKVTDVDQRNMWGETALHVAASRGHDRTIRVLLENGADLCAKDKESGWTVLHRAMYHEQLSTTLVLLQFARWKFGGAFAKEYLYETKDKDGCCAMALLTAMHGDVAEMEEEQGSEAVRGGMVYTFGRVDFQLGYHLPHMNVQSSPRVVEFPMLIPIMQVSASRFHTIALNRDGQVFAWGYGKGGRLGTGSQNNRIEPTLLTAFDEIPIAKVAAGENHSLALSCSGQVFSWGSNSFGQLGHNIKTCTQDTRLLPKRIDAFRGQTIIEIAASGCHSAAICEEHYVYTWGSNRKGQLGRKEGFGSDQPSAIPKRVDRLVSGHALSVVHEPHDALYAVQVAMSDVHTCVILRLVKQGHGHGQVWQFGNGSNVPSRVIFKDESRSRGYVLSDLWVPRWKMQSDDIVAVSCATNHSMALSACGAVYTWGHNGDALSHTQAADRQVLTPGAPQRVQLDQYGPISHICASPNHCAVVTRDGDLVTWGYGPQGVLGHGAGSSWQPSPKHVHGAKKVMAVAMGHQHTALLVCPRIPVFTGESTWDANSMKLRHILEKFIASHVDLSNVATVWKYAEVLSQTQLECYCHEYMKRNWDALLEMGGKERLDTLYHLVLPEDLILKSGNSISIKDQISHASSDVVRSTSKSTLLPRTVRKASISFTEEEVSIPHVAAPPDEVIPLETCLVEQRSTHARRKATKFIPLNKFLHDQSEPKPVVPAEKTIPQSPWNAPSQASVPSVPSTWLPLSKANSTPARKSSIDISSKTSPALRPSFRSTRLIAASPVLDSVSKRHTNELIEASGSVPKSTFALDAFIVKKNKRKKTRRTPSEKQCSWGPVASDKPANDSKSLRDIQAEEEAAAAVEANARAKLGGWMPKKSSINHWGLVEQPEHVSLADLQQREEQERIVAEQERILAQIQAEQQRSRQTEAASTSHRSGKEKKRSKPKKPKEQSDPNIRESATSTVTPDKKPRPQSTSRPRSKRSATKPRSGTASRVRGTTNSTSGSPSSMPATATEGHSASSSTTSHPRFRKSTSTLPQSTATAPPAT